MNAVSDFAACYHCGQPAVDGSRWQAVVGGEARTMCCPGCAAAAQAIHEAGLGDYYGSRTGFSARIEDAGATDPALRLVDDMGLDGDAVFTVEGLRCAACVWLIERRVAALPGVETAVMNVATERLHVRWDPAGPATSWPPCVRSATPPIPTTPPVTALNWSAPASRCCGACSLPGCR
jgi:Cu2+-exporting ATPase